MLSGTEMNRLHKLKLKNAALSFIVQLFSYFAVLDLHECVFGCVFSIIKPFLLTVFERL